MNENRAIRLNFLSFLIPITAVGLLTVGVESIAYAAADKPTIEVVDERNQFWESLDEEGLEGSSDLALLSQVLTDLLEEDNPTQALREFKIAESRFDRAEDHLNVRVVDPDRDGDTFDDEFIGMVEKASQGGLEGLTSEYDPNPTSWYQPTVLWTLGITVLLSQLASWLSVIVYSRHYNFGFKRLSSKTKRTLWCLGFPGMFVWQTWHSTVKRVRSLRNKRAFKEKEALRTARESKQEAVVPFGDDLKRARLNLKELMRLDPSPKVQQALGETRALIANLEEAVEQIIREGSDEVAVRILEETRSSATSLEASKAVFREASDALKGKISN